MATLDIKVPDIGDFADVAVIELMVKVVTPLKLTKACSQSNPTRRQWKFLPAMPAW